MKKGKYIIGGVIIVIAVVAISLFLMMTDNPEGEAPDLTGVWKVYQYGENTVDNEYMVFTADQVADYRDGSEDTYISSTFSWKGSDTIHLNDLNKDFLVKTVSGNNVILVEPNTMEWKLFRVTKKDVAVVDFDRAALVGEWTVVMHAGQPKTNEIITFTESTMVDSRDGKPFIESAYVWNEDGTFSLESVSHNFAAYAASDDSIILWDLTDGYLWELVRNP